MPGMVRNIRNGEITLATESFGDPSDPALVLIMGATASMLWWPEKLCTELAANGFFVVRYDLRDTGQSSTGAPGALDYGLVELEEDLLAILDGQGIEQAHLVGMSLGALIAQMTALRQPQRVASLTLIGAEPIGGAGEELPGMSEKFLAHFADFGTLDWSDRSAVRDFLLGIARLSAGTGRPFDSAAAEARIEAELKRTNTMQSAFNHSMLGGDLDPALRAENIEQPVLVIHGSDDPILPLPNGEAIVRAVQKGRLVVLERTGHELVAEDVPRIVDEIVQHSRGASQA